MLNESRGNMFEWVTHTWNPLGGECEHHCDYCYVKSMKSREVIKEKYSGAYRLVLKEFDVNLGEGNTIFVCNMTDLFAKGVSPTIQDEIIEYCEEYPKNTYLLLTKNPAGFSNGSLYNAKKAKYILGTTIETNRPTQVSDAPLPEDRARALSHWITEKVVSIEPIMDFDLVRFVQMINSINPSFVAIGADSKRTGLPEPPSYKIKQLIEELEKFTKVKIKKNLKRLLDV